MQYREQEERVDPITPDFDFSISACDLVSEWTLNAHWLSEISPWNVAGCCASVYTDNVRAKHTTPPSTVLPFIESTSNNYCVTTNLMNMPSWSSLQITVQTTTYSPGSSGAIIENSWVPALSNKSQPGTLERSLARNSENP